jgi:guanylate kinase
MYDGQLFIVSGPSGVGKGTICRELLKENIGIELSISMTTRKPRPGEVDGKCYYFVSHEQFESKIKADGFLEYARVYENYYGTPKQEVLDMLKKGTDVILEIDTQGALLAKKQYPNGVFIFILPPTMAVLRQRLVDRRSETEEQIKMRLDTAMTEISFITEYDYYIVNVTLPESVARMREIIMAERSKVTQNIHDVIQKYMEEK